MSAPRRTPYGYRVWSLGRTWTCHARGPSEWARSYGFATAKEAEWWGLDAIEEFGRNDAARAAAPSPERNSG